MPLITGWRRIGQHLGNAVARYVEMLCSLTPAHTFRASKSNPQIKFHGIDPQTLLHSMQKEDRWSDFTPPLRRDYRAVTVADFCTAALNRIRRGVPKLAAMPPTNSGVVLRLVFGGHPKTLLYPVDGGSIQKWNLDQYVVGLKAHLRVIGKPPRGRDGRRIRRILEGVPQKGRQAQCPQGVEAPKAGLRDNYGWAWSLENF